MWIALEWDNARAALPLSSVFEILSLASEDAHLVSVPRARVSAKGVVVHRGYVVPVFDPRRWKGFFKEIPASPDEYLVLIENEDSLDAVVVGRVDILRDAGPPPPEGGVPARAERSGGGRSGIGAAFAEGEFLARRGESAAEEAWAMLSLPRLAKAMHGE